MASEEQKTRLFRQRDRKPHGQGFVGEHECEGIDTWIGVSKVKDGRPLKRSRVLRRVVQQRQSSVPACIV
jgi:hypothetical protein